MNWGKGLIVAMGLFVIFIAVLTSIKLTKVNDLEHEDYYAREINYEQEIQAQRNANSFDKVEIKDQENFITIRVPESLEASEIRVILTRPNDKNLDKEYHFDDSKTHLISKDELATGVYKVEILYKVDGKDCLIKDEIKI